MLSFAVQVTVTNRKDFSSQLVFNRILRGGASSRSETLSLLPKSSGTRRSYSNGDWSLFYLSAPAFIAGRCPLYGYYLSGDSSGCAGSFSLAAKSLLGDGRIYFHRWFVDTLYCVFILSNTNAGCVSSDCICMVKFYRLDDYRKFYYQL
jgi:hypothetical protein